MLSTPRICWTQMSMLCLMVRMVRDLTNTIMVLLWDEQWAMMWMSTALYECKTMGLEMS